jgi:ABC-type transporter MlaC component
MKTTALSVWLACTFLGSINAADPGTALDQQVAAAIKEIQAQQATIADNQAKIDAKLATVGEAVRIARIYSSRGGH